jgi:hypothetical protein
MPEFQTPRPDLADSKAGIKEFNAGVDNCISRIYEIQSRSFKRILPRSVPYGTSANKAE